MIACEDFERHYLDFSLGRATPFTPEEMQRHRETCPYCASLTAETGRLRGLLGGALTLKPRTGFEMRLQQRLNNLGNRAAPRQPAYPRWAALGAGLATGLALAVFVILPRFTGQDSTPATAVSPGSYTQTAANIPDSLTNEEDSTGDTSYQYDADAHSRMVSTPR